MSRKIDSEGTISLHKTKIDKWLPIDSFTSKYKFHFRSKQKTPEISACTSFPRREEPLNKAYCVTCTPYCIFLKYNTKLGTHYSCCKGGKKMDNVSKSCFNPTL